MIVQDYLMRQINQMIRMLLKMLFGLDMGTKETGDIIEENSMEFDDLQLEQLKGVLQMADDGKIGEAEDLLFDHASSGDLSSLKMGLIFYDYLNHKGDDFLTENDFSRDEVNQGLQDFLSQYDISDDIKALMR